MSYFQRAGWTPEWIVTARKVIHDEFDCSYHFQDDVALATGPPDTNEPLVTTKNIFDSLLAFCTLQYVFVLHIFRPAGEVV